MNKLTLYNVCHSHLKNYRSIEYTTQYTYVSYEKVNKITYQLSNIAVLNEP